MMLPKRQYHIRNRTLGSIYISFSTHATQRLVDRNIDLLEVLSSLTVHSEQIINKSGVGEIAFCDNQKKFSVILSVDTTDKGIHYMNIITIIKNKDDEENLPYLKVKQVVQTTR